MSLPSGKLVLSSSGHSIRYSRDQGTDEANTKIPLW